MVKRAVYVLYLDYKQAKSCYFRNKKASKTCSQKKPCLVSRVGVPNRSKEINQTKTQMPDQRNYLYPGCLKQILILGLIRFQSLDG
jgi:hypothetical protein